MSTATLSLAEPPARLDLGLLIARIMLVAIFPISGYAKVSNIPGTTTYLANLGVPMPSVAVWGVLFCELVLPVLVILGVKARWAALGLILYTLGTAWFGHRFWELAGQAQFGQLMSFMKNVAMVGGLGIIALCGPGRFALAPRG